MNEAIALGLGNNIDYEIRWDSQVFEALIEELGIQLADLRPVNRITNVRDLVISTLDYIRNGIGIERYVEDLRVIAELAERFTKEITIGGTGPRAAIAMSRIGVPSSVHLVTINDCVRKLMPRSGSWCCSNSVDSSYPHLIVQYEKGARVAAGDIDITAPASTRLIYVNDRDNTLMKLDPGFFLNARNARICLISGFNAMQNADLLLERLRELGGFLGAFPDSVTVFYEDACFHTAAFRRMVLENLASLVDIFSLNEDELQGYVDGKIDLLDPRKILQSIRALHAVVRVPCVVIHTKFWALASGKGCRDLSAALERGITIAATRFRLGDHFSKNDFLRTGVMPVDQAGAEFSEAINRLGNGEIRCLPSVMIEEKKVTTIGLGDAFVGGFLSTFSGVQI